MTYDNAYKDAPSKLYVAIDDSFDQMAYRLFVFKREQGKRFHGKIEWVEYGLGEGVSSDCSIIMPHEDPQSKIALQTMLDQLWGIGFRPSRRTAEDHILAMSEHRDDLRKITFQLLNKVAGKDNVPDD